MIRRLPTFVLLALVLGSTVPQAAAQADTYPSRAVRLIVPFPPGGGTDIVARSLSARLTESLGQQVVDRKSTRLNSSHSQQSRMPSSA